MTRADDSRRGADVRLVIVPVTLDEANAFVEQHHRHRGPVVGAKFCVAVANTIGSGDHEDAGRYDWPLHMAEKEWVNAQQFALAFSVACWIHRGVPVSHKAPGRRKPG